MTLFQTTMIHMTVNHNNQARQVNAYVAIALREKLSL